MACFSLAAILYPNLQTSNFTSWSPDFPVQANLLEHCTVVGYEDNSARINDYSCDARRPVLCERKYNASKLTLRMRQRCAL